MLCQIILQKKPWKSLWKSFKQRKKRTIAAELISTTVFHDFPSIHEFGLG